MAVEAIIEYFVQNPVILVGCFLLYVVVFLLSLFFVGSRSGRKNPFDIKYIRPREPLVFDKKARAAVLKQKFKAANLDRSYDVVIIGSGIGGLTAAVLLGRAGKKVLVLEQHGKAGGCCHTFGSNGLEFDTGVHYIGEMQPNSLIRILSDQLTEGQVEWSPMHEEYDVAIFEKGDKVFRYPMCAGKKKMKERYMEWFPEEKKGIEKYFKLLESLRKGVFYFVVMKLLPRRVCQFLIWTGLINLFTSYFKLSSRTVQDVLDEVTDNEDLKATISYTCGDTAAIPEVGSFAMHGNLANHYLLGAFYPKGGPSQLPFHMVQIIEKNGGKVFTKAPVSKILVDDDGRATGVSVKTKDGNEVNISAKVVISDAGINNTLKKLLPLDVAKKATVYPLLSTLKQSISCMSVFISLDGDAEDLGIKACNTWIYQGTDINKSLGSFMSLSQEEVLDAEIPLLYVSFPSTKDPSWKERFPGKTSCVIITLANWEWFAEWQDEKLNHRGERYENLKNGIGQRVWAQCLRHFPQLDGKMIGMEVGSPVTNKHYLGFEHGEAYGLEHIPTRFSPENSALLRPDIGIPGLYLTGQDIFHCGLFGAVMGGVLCASSVLNRILVFDLQRVHNIVKKSQKQ